MRIWVLAALSVVVGSAAGLGLTWRELSADRRGEASSLVAERVWRARRVQAVRYRDSGISCNGGMGPAAIRRWAKTEKDGKLLLEHASRALGLSARAYHRILRVARTIADLAGEEVISTTHLAEAVAYRSLDRSIEPPIRSVGDWNR